MLIFTKIMICIVAIEHLYILWFEMFAWETVGKKTFKGAMPNELFTPTKKMAANQGLYNGFLAFGLLWSLFIEDLVWQKNIAIFFFMCVAIAGIYGAVILSRRIFFVQALPAIIGLVSLILNWFFGLA